MFQIFDALANSPLQELLVQNAVPCPSFINSAAAFGTNGPEVKSLSFRITPPRIQVLVPLLTSCATLGKLLNISELLFAPIKQR